MLIVLVVEEKHSFIINACQFFHIQFEVLLFLLLLFYSILYWIVKLHSYTD